MVNYYNASINDAKYGDVQVAKMCYGSETVWEHTQPVTGNYFATVARGSGTITLSGSSNNRQFQYSLNGGEWSTAATMSSVNVNAGDKVLWKGVGTGEFKFVDASDCPDFDIEGNVMSLIYGDDFDGHTDAIVMQGRFSGNTKIINAENLILPSTTVGNAYYQYMFQGCTNLRTAPSVLPATTMVESCYFGMFQGCTSLTTAPELPATTLYNQCYCAMFAGCTSLTTAPVLSATTLASQCYKYMFSGCTSLSSITCHATSFGYDSTRNWVLNVAPSGVFNYKHGTSWSQGGNGIPTGWMAIPMDDPYRNQYFTTVATSNGRIALSGRMSTFKFQYSLNGGQTWSTASQTPSVNVSAGDKVLWKANITGSTIGRFTSACTAYFNVEGNIMSLIYGDDFASQTTIPANAAFENLFSGNTRVSSAENLSLPATTLSSACYAGMFTKCVSMTKAPAILPATTLSIQCYRYMFSECGLNKAPALPATTLASQCYWSMFQGSRLEIAPALPANTLADYCYNNMFNGCTNLRTAHSVLPATTLANNCYNNMFYGCSRLTTAPELPAITLANNCYHGMFWGCSSLSQAPELPATTLADDCYSYMFVACSGLTTAPVLSATTLAQGCYDNMFNSCRSLNSITCLAHEPGTLYNSNWVNGVADTGTFTRYPAANWTRDANGIPTGWTVVDVEWPKYQAVIDGQPYSAQCDGETNITSSTTKPDGYNVSGITSAEVGACITSIGDYAFDRCENLSGVYIPYTVTSIGRQSFAFCHHLTDVRIPSSVTYIGQDAFYECSSMSAVVIPDSVTTMANSTFNRCSGATSLSIGTGLTQIPQSSFKDMRGLTTVTIPAWITSIGNGAFQNCTGLNKIVVNATVPPTLAYTNVFDNTNSCPIIVPCDSLEAYQQAWSQYSSRIDCQREFAGKCLLVDDMGVEYTYDCDGDTVIHADEYDEILDDYSITISSVTVGSCCTEVESGAFDGKRFTVLTIGSNVQSIGDFAFESVDGLTEIHVLATTPPTLGYEPFGVGLSATIYVPVGTVEDYQEAWSHYADRITEEGSDPIDQGGA